MKPRKRRHRNLRGRGSFDNVTDTFEYDDNERFVIRKVLIYLKGHLNRYFKIDDETLEILCWVLEPEIDQLSEFILDFFNNKLKSRFEEELEECSISNDDFPEILSKMLKKSSKHTLKKFRTLLDQLIADRVKALSTNQVSDIEKNAVQIKTMFKLSEDEMELIIFLFINEVFDKSEAFFCHHLNCNDFPGRKFLCNILNITHSTLTSILDGKLKQIGMLNSYRACIEIDSDFLTWFQNPSKDMLTKNLYASIPSTALPLDSFFIEQYKKRHVLNLLNMKPETATHLLFYGPPGSGKTSFAYSIANAIGIPSYKILGTKNNSSVKRQASIKACLNMTNTGSGSIVIVDEADSILNTNMSFFSRGETQDKGCLNQMMEIPGSRIIWITNYIDDIDSSVLRRFAYSIQFRLFNREQRLLLWENLLGENRCRHLVNAGDLKKLSSKYNVSAGAISLAICKSVETKARTKSDFLVSVTTTLDAHETLMNRGETIINKETVDKNYSLDGLNLEADMDQIIKQLRVFSNYLKTSSEVDVRNMNLLFYGPPGTGKSELAKYIGQQVDRKILCKRISDIHSKWVGESEKNIRDAFETAEKEEAILVIDEADTLLFSREMALTSWEVSFTNEFLTQMEHFQGILICSTNRITGIDSASLRRFSHKLRFHYLTVEGNLIFYKKMLSHLVKNSLDPKEKRLLKNIQNLAPGDFKTVYNKYSFYPENELNHKLLISALIEESTYKKIGKQDRRIGFQ